MDFIKFALQKITIAQANRLPKSVAVANERGPMDDAPGGSGDASEKETEILVAVASAKW